MKKFLLDTNILLDVALDREAFVEDSSKTLEWCEQNPGSAYIAWHSVSNLYYILRANKNEASTRQFISELLDFVNIAPSSTEQARKALALLIKDFEDALQTAVAISANLDAIVTRNKKDFKGCPLTVLSPSAFLKTVK